MPDTIRCQRTLAQQIARVQGEDSPAGRALKEFNERLSRGEQVVVFPLRGRWLVGPPEDVQEAVANAATRGRRSGAAA